MGLKLIRWCTFLAKYFKKWLKISKKILFFVIFSKLHVAFFHYFWTKTHLSARGKSDEPYCTKSRFLVLKRPKYLRKSALKRIEFSHILIFCGIILMSLPSSTFYKLNYFNFEIPNWFQIKEITIFWIWLEKVSFEQFPRNVQMATLEMSDNYSFEYFHYFPVYFVNASQS